MPFEKIPEFQAQAGFLKNKTILVTGAVGGIGSAVALSYAEHGATVILLDKNVRHLEMLYDTIMERGGPEPAIYPLDMLGATVDNYAELADVIEKEFGSLDGLVHCATQLGSRMMLEQYDPKLWAEVMQVDVTAPFLLTQACLPLLRKAEHASIIFSTAAAGRHGSAYWGAYGVANAAIENFMQILADELEVNTPVRVNSLDPGAVRSPLRNRVYPGEDPSTLPSIESVIPAYLYLMSEKTKTVTGKQFTA